MEPGRGRQGVEKEVVRNRVQRAGAAAQKVVSPAPIRHSESMGMISGVCRRVCVCACGSEMCGSGRDRVIVTVDAQSLSVAMARQSLLHNGLATRFDIRHGDL